MENDIAIFWFVCFTCGSGLFMGLTRGRAVGPGWMALYLAILLVAIAGKLAGQPALIYTALALWLLLVLLPGLIGRAYHRRFLQQQYPAARRLARMISYLHPADGWREQPEIIHALDLAQQGELTAALEILKRFREVKSLIGLAAVINLYRITNQWEELLAWHEQNRHEIDRHAQLLPVLLRARGETGDLRGMVELYDQHRAQIAKLQPASSRDVCRLMLFAFCGRQEAASRLVAGSLAVLPASTRAFWLATAELAAGGTDTARRQLEELLPIADPPLRAAIERRLSRNSIAPEPLGESSERIIEEAAREHGHDEKFGAQRSLFSKRARGTQTLIALNVLMFMVETGSGGSTNLDTLYRLGAMFSPDVRAGAWWRLFAALFLHFGPLHLAMNMFALWVLGPFTEFALGFRRFILVYLLAGVGSMGVVMALASGPNGDQLLVGASGSIMGLVGATGALMLRGWLREKAPAARRRLVAMVLIVAMQCVFDALVPHVSGVAHLSGALIGFAAALLLGDRLKQPAGQPSGLKSQE